jgi:hypothetical protein
MKCGGVYEIGATLFMKVEYLLFSGPQQLRRANYIKKTRKTKHVLPFKIKSYPVSVNQASSRETCKLIQMAVCLTSVWFLEANNYMVATYL